MEIKPILAFSTTKNDRLYAFHAPIGAPLGELYDATFEILNEITSHIQQAAKKAAPQEVASSDSESESV